MNQEPIDARADNSSVSDGEPDDRESAYTLLQRGEALSAGRHYAQAAIVLARAAPGWTTTSRRAREPSERSTSSTRTSR
jgi:hypothetical protein